MLLVERPRLSVHVFSKTSTVPDSCSDCTRVETSSGWMDVDLSSLDQLPCLPVSLDGLFPTSESGPLPYSYLERVINALVFQRPSFGSVGLLRPWQSALCPFSHCVPTCPNVAAPSSRRHFSKCVHRLHSSVGHYHSTIQHE